MPNTESVVKYSNKLAVIQVLAGLIKNPLLFADNTFRFSIDDFPEQFHKIVYGAIEHLAMKGLQKIDEVDINEFLKQYPVQYKVFCANKGIEYITKALECYDEKKFEYYYQTLKKYSLLNTLSQQGFDVKDILDPSIVDPVKYQAMQDKFDNMSVNDIILQEETKITLAKEAFGSNNDMVQNMAGDGAMELKERFKATPEMGLPFTSPKLTTLYRGLRCGALYTESSAQGIGKSRRQASESAHLAVPEYYDTVKKKWIKTKLCQSVLQISTELELSEVQTMWMAYISGVPEDHILDGKYKDDEEARVNKAIKLMQKAKLYFVSISNYDIDDIENLIKKYYQLYNVKYVFYDYLSTTLKIMAEGAKKSRISGLREDQILLMFTTRLKDLAKLLGISIFTATQLSGDWKNAKEADQQLLRGAKAISDKTDCSSILLPVREADKAVIDSYCAKGFEVVPTHVIHVFKVRRSHYNNIRLYVNFDRSTCRMTDCFVTDNQSQILPVEDTVVDLILDETKEEELSKAFPFEF